VSSFLLGFTTILDVGPGVCLVRTLFAAFAWSMLVCFFLILVWSCIFSSCDFPDQSRARFHHFSVFRRFPEA